MYMAKSPATKSKPLRWRTNCIRHWRDFRDGMTLEAAAEALSRPPYNLDYTHNSIGRIENGKQMPTIELIEALAKLYDTDVDSLLNRRPGTYEQPAARPPRGLLQLWDKAAADERGLIIDVARKVVKTGT
jgi:transcriptional regulator with XRE-family HTH domain